MTDIIKVDPKEYGLEENKAEQIKSAFSVKVVEKEGLVDVYKNILTSEITPELSAEAGELRKKIVKVRTGIAAIHKVEKAFYLAGGQFVDAIKRKETLALEQMEENLEKIERHYEMIEKKRLQELQESRQVEASQYGVPNPELINFSIMSDEVWDSFIEGAKMKHEAKVRQEKEREEAYKKTQEEKEMKRVLYSKRKEILLPYWSFLPVSYMNTEFGELSQESFDDILNKAKENKRIDDEKRAEQEKEIERLRKDAEEIAERERIRAKEQENRYNQKKTNIINIFRKHGYTLLNDNSTVSSGDVIVTEGTYMNLTEEEVEARIERAKERKKEQEELKRLRELELQKEQEQEAIASKGDKEKLEDFIKVLENLPKKYSYKSKKYKDIEVSYTASINQLVNHLISKM